MIWRKFHKWFSLPFGLILSAICLSGSILAFERELTVILAPTETGRLAFFRTVESIHRSLAMGQAGRPIVGISALVLPVILISGVAMWMRRASHGLRHSLNPMFPTPLRGMHVALGVYVTIILLLCALTGLTWSFGWFRDGFYFLFDGMTDEPLFHTIHALHTGRIGSLTTRILWCLSALVGASLPLTGYWLLIRKSRPKRPS